MNELMIYFLKVNIAIALFYLFYRLFFAGDTFWKTRRIYLLLSLFVSISYPFLSIETWLQNQEPVQVFVANYAMLQEFTVTPTQETGISLETIIYLIYGLISFVLLSKMIVQLFSILKIRIQGKVSLIQNTWIIAVQKELTPFSFFGSIYLNPTLHNEEETRQILAHELTHVHQGHSYDVILSELLTIAFWINPASWLLKREIRQNLEFLADNKVIESGFDSKSYQYHLLQLAYHTPEIKIANKFNVSPLKKRITMMNQQKTSKAGILKYLLIIPLAAALVLSSNAQSVVTSAKKSSTTVKEKKVVQAQGKEKIYDVVEKMPEFPGGENEMMKYLAMNIKYPVEAQKKGIQGRVICQFVVKSDGSIGDVVILRSVDPNLDAEAIRVVKAMPLWKPGQQKGKNVNVKYTLPVIYKLQGNEKAKKQTNNSSEAFTVVEKMPQFPGGEDKMLKYIGNNLKYPVNAQKKGIQGKVIVGFIVNKIGKVENAEVLRSLDTECDKEALRVVNAMPMWTPGQQKGKNVNVKYTLPITYKLQ